MFEKLKENHAKKKLFKELSKEVTLSKEDFYIFDEYYNFVIVYRFNLKLNNMKIVSDLNIRNGNLSIKFYLPENSDEVALTIYENKSVYIPNWLLSRLTKEELIGLVKHCSNTVLNFVDEKVKEDKKYKDELASHIKSVI